MTTNKKVKINKKLTPKPIPRHQHEEISLSLVDPDTVGRIRTELPIFFQTEIYPGLTMEEIGVKLRCIVAGEEDISTAGVAEREDKILDWRHKHGFSLGDVVRVVRHDRMFRGEVK